MNFKVFLMKMMSFEVLFIVLHVIFMFWLHEQVLMMFLGWRACLVWSPEGSGEFWIGHGVEFNLGCCRFLAGMLQVCRLRIQARKCEQENARKSPQIRKDLVYLGIANAT